MPDNNWRRRLDDRLDEKSGKAPPRTPPPQAAPRTPRKDAPSPNPSPRRSPTTVVRRAQPQAGKTESAKGPEAKPRPVPSASLVPHSRALSR
ncbi:MAG: hypothetical protein JXA52_02705, partial [Planctomycetes bacterium]|nr:hypothetical protein [Planctomycetota bacterium]